MFTAATPGSVTAHNIFRTWGETLASCMALCEAEPACKSLDFAQSSGQCNLGDCQIGDGVCTWVVILLYVQISFNLVIVRIPPNPVLELVLAILCLR